MLKPYEPPESEREPAPECRETVDLIQRALDGEVAMESLDADPHAAACAACRERVRAARVLLSVLAAPRETVAVPAGFADRVASAVCEERAAQPRRTYAIAAKIAACAALAAAVVVGAFVITNRPQPQGPNPSPFVPPVEVAKQPEPAPAPREKAPAPAPEPRPIRIGDEVAKAGQTLLEAPQPLADSVAVAPKLFEAIVNPFKLPDAPPDPMAAVLEPARKSLTELPHAAQASLEPVTGTAEKAFKRFLNDVGAVKPNS